MASLFVIRGRDQGKRFQLEDPVHTVGRTQSSSIRLHDTEVSRAHAELIRKGESYILRDLGSSNGTFVNGQQASEHELVSGDQLQFGRSLVLFTGNHEESWENIDEQVDIIARGGSNDESHIVAALSHSGGSDWLLPDEGSSSSPWIARARSNLQIMYRTALAISHTMDIDQLLARIMEMIFEWVDADRGCIMLKDVETDKLVPKVRRHRRGVRIEEKITISKTILDYVVQHNEGVLTSNARDDERWDPAQSIVKLGVREAICVPMQGRYNVVGVIYIDTSITPQRMLMGEGQSDQFTEEHLRLMIAIAHQAALAVEDTSYYKALVQAERLAAVGQTIASLSHHIKNILQGVRGGSYLIELGLGDYEKMVRDHASDASPAGEAPPASQADPKSASAVETIRKGWGIVERNQERISSLVMDMLTFSKERTPEPVPSDLNALTSEVAELLQVRAQEADVKLTLELDTALPTLMFDPEAMHRAIMNVLGNAIDACEDTADGRVVVRSSYLAHDNLARVVIQDNGPGIAPDDLEVIFNVFVSRKGGHGTGLGLPVTRKILEEHGGQILADSQVGQGSQFTLELPTKVQPSEAPHVPAPGHTDHAAQAPPEANAEP